MAENFVNAVNRMDLRDAQAVLAQLPSAL